MSTNINPARLIIALMAVLVMGVGCYLWGQQVGSGSAAANYQNQLKQQLEDKQREAYYRGCTTAYVDLLPKDYDNYQKLTDTDLARHTLNMNHCQTLRDVVKFTD